MMDYKALIKRLRDISVQTGSLCCFGCGYEHNCGIHGCAVLKEAAAALCALSDEVFGLKAELETARTERDAAAESWRGFCAKCARNGRQYLPDGQMDDRCRTCRENGMCNWRWRGIKGKEHPNDKV